MTPHDLLAAFEPLAEAPDGIARLRELILQLAVRGKLVPQDPNDEPACILLERIAAEKARLVKEGKIPKAKLLPSVGKSEVPFVVPEEWVWCRAEHLFEFVTSGSRGWAQFYSKDGPVFLRIGNLDYGTTRLDLSNIQHVCPPASSEGTRTRTMPGDILVSITGDTGMVGLIPDGLGEAYINQHIAMCRPVVGTLPRYIAMAFTTPPLLDQLWDNQRGIKNSLGLDDIRILQCPLPPLPEQHRIVAKVDTLMGLLDHLEAARSERETTRVALRNAALVTLRDAPDAEAVEVAWTRIAERMDDLFTDPADVASLRQTILQLAVRGKLVPQDPNDEPACLLLERIAAEKARLVKEGRLPKPKLLPQVAEDDMPFEVPSRWMYARLNNLLIEDSRNGLSAQPNQGPPGIEILRISAGTARNDAVVMEEDHRFLELEEEAILTYELQRGDLLACRFNGNLHYVGRVAVYEKYSGHRQVYPDKLIRLRVHQSLINPWYIRLAMNCQGIRSVIERTCATTAGNIGISATNLKTVAIPIPPLQEQHRIVTKVNALMALCDALEARFAASRAAQAAFAAAAVHHLDA